MTNQSNIEWIVTPKAEVRAVVRKPSMWTCLFLNDRLTPWDFVIEILVTIFNQQPQVAEAITEKIDKDGRATVGIYPKDIAEQKAYQSRTLAASRRHPLVVLPQELI